MAYGHKQITINSLTSTELVITGWNAIYIQNNSPSRARVSVGVPATRTTGIRVMPNTTLPLPIAGETPAGAVNAILEEEGAGDQVMDMLEDR